MAAKFEKSSEYAGCALGVVHLMVTMPMWYALMFGILLNIEAAPWMWVVFWIYMPVGILLGILSEFVKAMARGGD